MSEGEKRADLLQELDAELDAIERVMFEKQALGSVYGRLGALRRRISTLPLPDHRVAYLETALDAARDASMERPVDQKMLRRFYSLLHGLLEDCIDE